MASCIEKFPDKNSEEYKQCQQQKAVDAWDAKINVGEAELSPEEEVILNDYNKVITLTKEDETEAINFLNKKAENFFKNAEYYKEGSSYTMASPRIKKRTANQLKKYIEDSDYTYEDYLNYQETGTLPVLNESQIEEEKNIIIKNKKRNFLEEVDNDVRISIEQKLIRQQDIAKKALDKNKFLQNQIVQVNDKGELTGGDLFNVNEEMRRLDYSLTNAREKAKPKINSIQKRVDDAATFTNAEGEKIIDIDQKISYLNSL